MLTVRELLRDLDVSLLAGEDAADAPVRWVHISELADPTPWLSGGELLLCTGMALHDPDDQRAFVTRLADHGLAGLGFGVGFGHDATPPALVEAARDRDFPLFEVPYDTPFIAITEKAFATLVNEGYDVLRRSIAAQERLQRIVLSERGLDAVAGALATLLGGAALVFDGRGEPLAQRTFRRELDASAVTALSAKLRDRARAGAGESFAPDHPEIAGRALALPVAASGEARGGPDAVPQAWLVAVKDTGGLAEFDRLLLQQAVTVVALELLRRRVAGTTEKRLAGDVLTQLASGALSGDELVRRLAPFGLGSRVAALAFAGATVPVDRVEDALEVALRDEAVDGLVARRGELACALVPGYAEEELFELADRVRLRVAQALGDRAGLRAAAGRAVATGDARRTYHEARCALEARALSGSSAAGGNGAGEGAGRDAEGVATYRDLGSFQLLLSLQGTDALRLYCDSLLGPLEEGEGAYGGELVRSLEAFIECNGQWEAAARRLYCHRHTLRYRVRRIEELTGRDLGSARDRIEFWLALRGRELVA